MSSCRRLRAAWSAAALCSVVALGVGSPLWATEEEEHGQPEGHGETAEHHADGTGHAHSHEFSLSLGVSDEHGHDLEGTWGLDYEHFLSERWGIGGLIDYAGGSLRNLVIAVPVFFHATRFLRFAVAPGVEFHNGRGFVESPPHLKSGDPSTQGYDGDETYFIVRLGASYSIPVGSNYGVAPAVNLDLVNGEKVWVYGLGLYYAW